MTQEQQAKAFSHAVGRMIDHHIDEYDLTIESMVGVLELHKFRLIQDIYDREEED